MRNSTKQGQPSVALAWIICGLGALFYCYEYFLRVEPSVMLTELMRHFRVTAQTVGLLSGFYYWAYAPMQVGVGLLTDRFGARAVLTLAVGSCAIGSLIFGVSDTLFFAGVGRFLIGLGSAFAFVGVLKLAAVWLPIHRFSLFAGIATGLGMVGAMVGDGEMTALVHKLGWREAIYIGTAFGFVLMPIIWFVIRDNPNGNGAVSAPELMDERHKVETLKEAFAGLWCVVKNPQMWLIGTVGSLLFMSLSVFAELWGIPFLHYVYHFTPQQAAYANSMVFLGWLVGAPFIGWISDAMQTRRLPMSIGSFLASGIIALLIYHNSFSQIEVFALLFLFGACCSVQIVCFAMGRESNATAVAATALSFVNLLVMLSGVIFQPLIGKLLDIVWSGKYLHDVPQYTATDFQHALVILPIAMMAACFISFFIRETYGTSRQYELTFE